MRSAQTPAGSSRGEEVKAGQHGDAPLEDRSTAEAAEPIDITPVAADTPVAQATVDQATVDQDVADDEPPPADLGWVGGGGTDWRHDDGPRTVSDAATERTSERKTGPAASRRSSRRSSRTRRIALGAALAAGLAGAAVLGTAGVRIAQQKDATLSPPDAVAGLRRDTGENAVQTAESLRTVLAAGADLDETVAAVYADPANPDRNVFFFGGTALLFSPDKELDEVLKLLGERGATPTGMREVEAGDLGGVMKCGVVTVPEGTMSACGWADHGSVAVAMYAERDIAEAATLTRQLRTAAQTRD